ncbi:MAG: hypothetical protein WDW38_010386 [Sanguina aurantia]
MTSHVTAKGRYGPPAAPPPYVPTALPAAERLLLASSRCSWYYINAPPPQIRQQGCMQAPGHSVVRSLRNSGNGMDHYYSPRQPAHATSLQQQQLQQRPRSGTSMFPDRHSYPANVQVTAASHSAPLRDIQGPYSGQQFLNLYATAAIAWLLHPPPPLPAAFESLGSVLEWVGSGLPYEAQTYKPRYSQLLAVSQHLTQGQQQPHRCRRPKHARKASGAPSLDPNTAAKAAAVATAWGSGAGEAILGPVSWPEIVARCEHSEDFMRFALVCGVSGAPFDAASVSSAKLRPLLSQLLEPLCKLIEWTVSGLPNAELLSPSLLYNAAVAVPPDNSCHTHSAASNCRALTTCRNHNSSSSDLPHSCRNLRYRSLRKSSVQEGPPQQTVLVESSASQGVAAAPTPTVTPGQPLTQPGSSIPLPRSAAQPVQPNTRSSPSELPNSATAFARAGSDAASHPPAPMLNRSSSPCHGDRRTPVRRHHVGGLQREDQDASVTVHPPLTASTTLRAPVPMPGLAPRIGRRNSSGPILCHSSSSSSSSSNRASSPLAACRSSGDVTPASPRHISPPQVAAPAGSSGGMGSHSKAGGLRLFAAARSFLQHKLQQAATAATAELPLPAEAPPPGAPPLQRPPTEGQQEGCAGAPVWGAAADRVPPAVPAHHPVETTAAAAAGRAVITAAAVPSAPLCASVGPSHLADAETFTARPGVSVQQQQPPPLCSHTPLSVQPLPTPAPSGPMGSRGSSTACNLVGEGGSVPATAGDSSLGSSNISGDGNEPAGTMGLAPASKPAAALSLLLRATSAAPAVGPAFLAPSYLDPGCAELGLSESGVDGLPARPRLGQRAVCPLQRSTSCAAAEAAARHSALSELSGLFVQRSAGSVNTVIGLHPSYLAFLAAPTAAHTTHLLRLPPPIAPTAVEPTPSVFPSCIKSSAGAHPAPDNTAACVGGAIMTQPPPQGDTLAAPVQPTPEWDGADPAGQAAAAGLLLPHRAAPSAAAAPPPAGLAAPRSCSSSSNLRLLFPSADCPATRTSAAAARDGGGGGSSAGGGVAGCPGPGGGAGVGDDVEQRDQLVRMSQSDPGVLWEGSRRHGKQTVDPARGGVRETLRMM